MLIELFSALGALVEVAYQPLPPPSRAVSTRRYVGTSRPSISYGSASSSMGQISPSAGAAAAATTPRNHAIPGTLGLLGYWSSSPSMPRTCDASRRFKHPNLHDFTIHAVPPVVSSRLITSKAVKEQVLAYAAAKSGLHALQSTNLPPQQQAGIIAVPSKSIATEADARWIAVPGRYAVSRKVDGTRHLLVVDKEGKPYLMNRVGAMYAYPMSSSRTCVAHNVAAPAVVAAACGSAGAPCGSSSSSGSQAKEVGSSESEGRGSGSRGSSTGGTTVGDRGKGEALSKVGGGAGTTSNKPFVIIMRLPPGTVLDGELVWIPSACDLPAAGAPSGMLGNREKAAAEQTVTYKGFFIAFDVLCLGGKRVWQLPLQQRQEILKEQLQLVEAEECEELRVASGRLADTASAPAAAVAAPAPSAAAPPAPSPPAAPAPAAATAAAGTSSGGALALSKKQQAPPTR